MKVSGALIEAIVGLLRGVGLLEDPQREVDLRRQLSELEKANADVWVDFVRATTPNANRVYVWTNSIIALVRPALSALIVGGMIFAPSRMLDLVRTFGDAGEAGWIIMAPVMWWFFGRDVGKVLALRYGGFTPVGSGAAVPVDMPATGPVMRGGEATCELTGPCEPCTHIGQLLGVPDAVVFQQNLQGRRGQLARIVATDGDGFIRVGDAVTVLRSSDLTPV